MPGGAFGDVPELVLAWVPTTSEAEMVPHGTISPVDTWRSAEVEEVKQRRPAARHHGRRPLEGAPVDDRHLEKETRVEERLDDGARGLKPATIVLGLEE